MNLSINTGLKEYNLTDANGNVLVTVFFNPTDPAFLERLYNVFASLDKMDVEYHERMQKEKNNTQLFETARELDANMRKMIDKALGADVCTPIFGGISVYAWADGLPLWANLLLSIIDEMDDALTREKNATDPRLEKYTKKFNKK